MTPSIQVVQQARYACLSFIDSFDRRTFHLEIEIRASKDVYHARYG